MEGEKVTEIPRFKSIFSVIPREATFFLCAPSSSSVKWSHNPEEYQGENVFIVDYIALCCLSSGEEHFVFIA